MNARKHKKTVARTKSRSRNRSSSRSAGNTRNRRRGHAKMESPVAAESGRIRSTNVRPANLNSEQDDLYSSGKLDQEEPIPSAESTEDEEVPLDPNSREISWWDV